MILFSEHGFEASTTKGIAEQAGVTEAVIFRYFPSKQELFRAVVDEYVPPLHYPMPYEENRHLPFGDALTSLFRGYLDNSWINRRSMRLFLLATFHDPEILRRLNALFEHRKDRLNQMLTERVQTGELRKDAAAATEILTLATTGFLVRSLRCEPTSFPLARDAFLEELVKTVGRGLLAQ